MAAHHVVHAAIRPQNVQPHKCFAAVGAVHHLDEQAVNVGAAGHRGEEGALHFCAVFQRVRHVDIVGIRAAAVQVVAVGGVPAEGVAAVLIVLLEDGAVEGDHALHRRGIVSVQLRRADAEADGVHIVRIGDAVLEAGDVQPDAAHHRHQHRHHGGGLHPPAFGENAEFLLQQHLGGEEADHAHDDLAEEQAEQPAAVEGGVVQEQPQPQTAAQPDAPARHRPQPAEGDGVARRFAGTFFVEIPDEEQQRDAHGGVDAADGERLRRQLLQRELVARFLHGDPTRCVGLDALPDPHHRCQKTDGAGELAAGVTEIEQLRHS